jgi:hypothetical protein
VVVTWLGALPLSTVNASDASADVTKSRASGRPSRTHVSVDDDLSRHPLTSNGPPVSSVYACTSTSSKALPFCNPALSMPARVEDLLQRLTTDEKVSLLGAHGGDLCAFEDGGVPRLDIPSCKPLLHCFRVGLLFRSHLHRMQFCLLLLRWVGERKRVCLCVRERERERGGGMRTSVCHNRCLLTHPPIQCRFGPCC